MACWSWPGRQRTAAALGHKCGFKHVALRGPLGQGRDKHGKGHEVARGQEARSPGGARDTARPPHRTITSGYLRQHCSQRRVVVHTAGRWCTLRGGAQCAVAAQTHPPHPCQNVEAPSPREHGCWELCPRLAHGNYTWRTAPSTLARQVRSCGHLVTEHCLFREHCLFPGAGHQCNCRRRSNQRPQLPHQPQPRAGSL